MVNVVNKLNITPAEIKDCMTKKEGDVIKVDEVLAKSSSFFGLFKSICTSPINGTVETISSVTGQLLLREAPIPVEIAAYVDGIVDEVIEAEGVNVKTWGTYIQGIFGVGGEVVGPLKIVSKSVDKPLTVDDITEDLSGKIIVGGSLVTNDVIQKAKKHGVKGIIVGGLDDKDLKELLGYDLGVAITGHEEIGLTIVVTEGFGQIKMAEKTYDILKRNEGLKTSINGATQIRAGVIRPEVIVPLMEKYTMEEVQQEHESRQQTGMDPGSPIRVIRKPYFGVLGTVVSLPHNLTKMESETKVRVVEVKLETGETVILPRANVETIES
jgi:transcription antitermination factor NusG